MKELNAQETHPLIGCSVEIRRLRAAIDKLSGTECPVLISGETGTGKEVVARAIHAAGDSKPFVVVDCSTLTENLAESELFGNAKGAFTGAVAARPGLLVAANGGTAFFDEIGELPLHLQPKLLRACQMKTFRAIGSVRQERSDFRIISATNRNLEEEVAAGRFRQDLYYRLNVATIRIAPLRDRPEDIPMLVQHFLRRFHRCDELSPELEAALITHSWPGNVRELENAIQRIVSFANGPSLGVTNLPSSMGRGANSHDRRVLAMAAGAASSGGATPATCGAKGEDSVRITMAALERIAILNAYRETGGDIARAALRLNIGRTTVYRKIRQYQQQGYLPVPKIGT